MSQKKPITIKKYPNRRLYNTEISDYITLEDLYQMVKREEDFIVVDAKTGEDLTRITLTQIIFEQEAKGYNLLPVSFLRQIIGFYDNSLRNIVPHYLDNVMQNFSQNQHNLQQMSDNMNKTLGEFSPFKMLEEISKQNMTIFEQSMKMFFNQDNKK